MRAARDNPLTSQLCLGSPSTIHREQSQHYYRAISDWRLQSRLNLAFNFCAICSNAVSLGNGFFLCSSTNFLIESVTSPLPPRSLLAGLLVVVPEEGAGTGRRKNSCSTTSCQVILWCGLLTSNPMIKLSKLSEHLSLGKGSGSSSKTASTSSLKRFLENGGYPA